ncbi:unnamed protein product [Effrenium voratum]|nr:unnamed protein product [Effrenium voratum]
MSLKLARMVFTLHPLGHHARGCSGIGAGAMGHVCARQGPTEARGGRNTCSAPTCHFSNDGDAVSLIDLDEDHSEDSEPSQDAQSVQIQALAAGARQVAMQAAQEVQDSLGGSMTEEQLEDARKAALQSVQTAIEEQVQSQEVQKNAKAEQFVSDLLKGKSDSTAHEASLSHRVRELEAKLLEVKRRASKDHQVEELKVSTLASRVANQKTQEDRQSEDQLLMARAKQITELKARLEWDQQRMQSEMQDELELRNKVKQLEGQMRRSSASLVEEPHHKKAHKVAKKKAEAEATGPDMAKDTVEAPKPGKSTKEAKADAAKTAKAAAAKAATEAKAATAATADLGFVSEFQTRCLSVSKNSPGMEQQALMDDQSQDFSFQTVRRLLRRLPRRPEKMQFQELRLAPDVAFAFGGCASGERPADFEACVARQVDSLHVKGLGYLCERLRQAEGDMFVCLESALPAEEPRPSIGFVIAQWFIAHVSQCGVEDVYQGHLERTPGSLAETVAMLALLEFLTEGTASRVVTVKVREGGTQCLSELELQAVFGAPEAQSVRGTPVMRLFEGIDAKERLHSILRDLRPQADCARGVELLAAAAQCLEAAESYGSPREEVLRRLPVDISWDGLHPSLSEILKIRPWSSRSG